MGRTIPSIRIALAMEKEKNGAHFSEREINEKRTGRYNEII
jgi:hypothetical protein